MHFRSPHELKRRANAFSRGDDTRSKVRAVHIVNLGYRSLSILLFTLGGWYYPGPRGLCRLCILLPCFSFPKFLRFRQEGQRDLIEYVEISCEGIGAASLVSLC